VIGEEGNVAHTRDENMYRIS